MIFLPGGFAIPCRYTLHFPYPRGSTIDTLMCPPPVQVTVATTTCASRVSVLVGHRKRPPVQVTVAPAPFAPPHVPESKCAQWLKKKTTSASYSRSEPPPPHGASTMDAFSICAIALEKTPPPSPHSASYNIAATTTCASKVSVLVGHREKDHQCKLQ